MVRPGMGEDFGMSTPDNTRSSGPEPETADPAGVRGGDADRLDSPGDGSGGMPSAGADGETAAREQLRKDLGERAEDAGTEG